MIINKKLTYPEIVVLEKIFALMVMPDHKEENYFRSMNRQMIADLRHMLPDYCLYLDITKKLTFSQEASLYAMIAILNQVLDHKDFLGMETAIQALKDNLLAAYNACMRVGSGQGL